MNMFNLTVVEFLWLVRNAINDAEALFARATKSIDEHDRQSQSIRLQDGGASRYRHMEWDRLEGRYVVCSGTNGDWRYVTS
jgi:hypothetical protein